MFTTEGEKPPVPTEDPPFLQETTQQFVHTAPERQWTVQMGNFVDRQRPLLLIGVATLVVIGLGGILYVRGAEEITDIDPLANPALPRVADAPVEDTVPPPIGQGSDLQAGEPGFREAPPTTSAFPASTTGQETTSSSVATTQAPTTSTTAPPTTPTTQAPTTTKPPTTTTTPSTTMPSTTATDPYQKLDNCFVEIKRNTTLYAEPSESSEQLDRVSGPAQAIATNGDWYQINGRFSGWIKEGQIRNTLGGCG